MKIGRKFLFILKLPFDNEKYNDIIRYEMFTLNIGNKLLHWLCNRSFVIVCNISRMKGLDDEKCVFTEYYTTDSGRFPPGYIL